MVPRTFPQSESAIEAAPTYSATNKQGFDLAEPSVKALVQGARLKLGRSLGKRFFRQFFGARWFVSWVRLAGGLLGLAFAACCRYSVLLILSCPHFLCQGL